MPRFEQELLKPGQYRLAGGRLRSLSAGDLRACLQNTAALLRRGYLIPLLPRHAAPGADSGAPRLFSESTSGPGPRAAGFLACLVQRPDGALVQSLEISDAAALAAIASGRIRHTSAELREQFIDRAGREYGLVIAHVALTQRPRYRNQPPLTASDDVFQFSFDSSLAGAPSMSTSPTIPSAGAENPSETLAAFVPPARSGDPNEQPSSPPDDERDEPLPQQPETDQSADRPPVAEAATDEGVPETPDRDAAADALVARIRASRRLPRGLRERLAAAVQTIQLAADDQGEPTIRVADAVSLLEESLPPQLVLAAEQLQSAAHPQGEAFFSGDPRRLSDEQAAQIAAEQLAATGFARRKA